MNATSAREEVLRHKADLDRSLKLCTAEGILAMPVVTMSLPVNVFATALFTQAFPLPNTAIGLISALPFVGNFIQVFFTSALLRRRPPKSVTILAEILHLITWIALGVGLPFIPNDDPLRAGALFVGWFLVSSIFAAVAGVSWNAWIEEWVPARVRGKYFGRRNGILQIAVLVFLLAAGWILARWEYAIPAFQFIIAVAAVTRGVSIYWQWISPTRARRTGPDSRRPLAEQMRVLAGARSFIVFIAFGAVWAFAANCFGPFYHVFLFEELHLSAFDVGVLSTLSQLGGALSLPAWGSLLDRHGNKSVMTLSLVLWQVPNFAWCWIGPNDLVLLHVVFAWTGMMGAGFVLGQFTILLRLIPPQAKNLAIGVNLAVVSLVAASAPVVGGFVLTAALAGSEAAGPADPFTVYHACFAVQPIVALAGAFLLLRVHEPAASSFSSVVGAMRNIRTLSGVLGLSFLVNYVFLKPRRR